MKKSTNDTCHFFFSTLANPTRLAILETLQEGPKNVAGLAKLLNHERSMISHNLKPLEKCIFVFSERKGKTREYRVNREIINPLFELVNFHASKYCPNGRVCLTSTGLERFKKEEAAKPLFLNQK